MFKYLPNFAKSGHTVDLKRPKKEEGGRMRRKYFASIFKFKVFDISQGSFPFPFSSKFNNSTDDERMNETNEDKVSNFSLVSSFWNYILGMQF